MLLNIRFCNFLAVKSYAKSRSVNHFRDRAKEFSKTNAKALLKQSKGLRFRAQILSLVLNPKMLLPRSLLSQALITDYVPKRQTA